MTHAPMPHAPMSHTSAPVDTTPARRRLLKDLAVLRWLYDELAGALTRPRRVVEKVSERGSPGIPLDTRVLDARSDIRSVLTGWAALVREQRGVVAPERDTAALTAFLARHADWLAAHPAAADLAAETGELIRAAWSALSGHRDRHVVVGACVRPGCPGRLAARLGTRAAAGEAAIVCSADTGHTWSPELWHTLGPRGERPGPGAGFTAQEISVRWGVASGTVYWLASTHGWGRRKEGRRVLYDRADVVATMRARATDQALAG
ncbi:hypothetical protein J7W19_31725 [Streptomyces mobaraensis NBRC 13819 = DSM 40847]|uniref:Helix-turn-helix domain-containing protein n=2 Tax=Streptomyces mobaraensis TaxID=35621 RepID=A0A5N5W5M4_STRMB|nr:hypothetical protein [Streptomyces mobaraensis]EMF00397.1 hypothetical protein H340_11830 [Streptomyces mobaraensis NBRC 13819 = DSM 40847]KAB7839569.1 hypothetical protein FRZ00_21825 [Streptomyces mobaraensis]QTT77350.1 hypothetical protein J7W19_31725 [Streptomyces mobaraensis NBRC 13819 = DSM 40847]